MCISDTVPRPWEWANRTEQLARSFWAPTADPCGRSGSPDTRPAPPSPARATPPHRPSPGRWGGASRRRASAAEAGSVRWPGRRSPSRSEPLCQPWWRVWSTAGAGGRGLWPWHPPSERAARCGLRKWTAPSGLGLCRCLLPPDWRSGWSMKQTWHFYGLTWLVSVEVSDCAEGILKSSQSFQLEWFTIKYTKYTSDDWDTFGHFNKMSEFHCIQ